MADTTAEDQLAARLARALLEIEAPHELSMFRAASRAYFDNPDRALRRPRGDELLGFGKEGLVALTPYALAVAAGVIAMLKDRTGRPGAEPAAEAVLTALPGILSGHGESVPPTPEQVDLVRQLSLMKARELKLDEEGAGRLADAMARTLVPDSA